MSRKQVGSAPSDNADLVSKGYADSVNVPVTQITATGSRSNSTFLRGDGAWAQAGITTGKAIAMAMVFG